MLWLLMGPEKFQESGSDRRSGKLAGTRATSSRRRDCSGMDGGRTKICSEVLSIITTQ